MSKKHKSKKNSLLIGGLTSTAGMFITKAIGLLYVGPFKSMVLSENYVYYAAGYELYDLMLTISLAGLPFAIAAIVSKYMEKEDYKTVMLVKKISQGLLLVFGFISASVVLIFINKFVGTRGTISLEQAEIYKNVYMIMTLSIFTVPLLSSYRGFFQGIKNYGAYSLSQIIEQISRVTFLLGIGALGIYVFDTSRIFGVYAALVATAVSAVTAILYLTFFNKESVDEIAMLASEQEEEAVDSVEILVELFKFSIPYLLSVILSNRFGFSNMVLLPNALQTYGYDTLTTQLYTSLITNETIKLIGIPTVLSTGFSVAIIPEISEALVRNDYRTIQRDIRLSIESVLYIGLPVLCAMYFLSDEIYFALFGGTTDIIKMGGEVLKAQVILALISNLTPVINSLTMTLNLRKETIIILIIAFALNFILLPIFVKQFGWVGSMITIMLTTILVIFYCLYLIKTRYKVDFKYTIRKIMFMCVGLFSMYGVYFILNLLNIDIISLGRFKGILMLGVYGILMVVAYLVTTNILYLPQSILNIDLGNIVKRLKR